VKLVDKDIREAILRKEIAIVPFDDKALGSNSYDVHLGTELLVYKRTFDRWHNPEPLDCRKRAETISITIPPEGLVLMPGELYLGSTVEYTESLATVPTINGKSSLGRFGLSVHVTAGTGDVGFKGHWTLELTVVIPLRIYAGMAVAQLLWDSITGQPDRLYHEKPDAKYTNAHIPGPQASEMARNFSDGYSDDK